jgi:hypothetical protein
MAGPSNLHLGNRLPRTDLAGPGLSPEEASANAVAKIVKQLADAGIPLPTPRELTTVDHRTHSEETRRRFDMGPGSGTTWESVLEVEYFVQGEQAAKLPNGYFYPGMPEIRRAQLAAIVPEYATHMPTTITTPSPAGNPTLSSQW